MIILEVVTNQLPRCLSETLAGREMSKQAHSLFDVSTHSFAA